MNKSHHSHESEKKGTPSQEPSLFKDHEKEDFIERYDTKRLLMGIKRHTLLILICAGLLALLGALLGRQLSTRYVAEAALLYQKDEIKRDLIGYSLTSFTRSAALDMITLPANFRAIKSSLGLELSPEELQAMVNVPNPKGGSNLIKILAHGNNPRLVVDVANALARVAVKNSQEFAEKQLEMTQKSFNQQYEIAKRDLITSLEKIENFKKEHRYFEMDAKNSSLLQQIAQARSRLQNAELNYNRMLVEYENLRKEVANLSQRKGTSSLRLSLEASLQDRLVSLEHSLLEARSKFAPNNPKIKILEEQIESLRKRLSESEANTASDPSGKSSLNSNQLELELIRMQGRVKSARKLKEDLEEAYRQLEQGLETLPAEQAAFARLLEIKAAAEEKVKFIGNSLHALDIFLEMPKGSLELYQQAEKAAQPERLRLVDLLPIFGIIFGSGLGLVAAFFLELTNGRLCTSREIELYYNTPCLMVIPEIPFLFKRNAYDKTLFYIRTLSERLEHIPKPFPFTFLAITSSIAQEGKSCLAYHLALYYQKLGKKTVILDFDYRKNPFINSPSTISAPIEEYLKNKASFEEIIQRGKPDVARVGLKPEPEMKELVKTEQMTLLWDLLRQSYDFVIVETPGIVESDYAPNLAALADACIFIVGSSKTKKPLVDASLKELDLYGKRPAGIVLNRVFSSYIDDERIKAESGKNTKNAFRNFFYQSSLFNRLKK